MVIKVAHIFPIFSGCYSGVKYIYIFKMYYQNNDVSNKW